MGGEQGRVDEGLENEVERSWEGAEEKEGY